MDKEQDFKEIIDRGDVDSCRTIQRNLKRVWLKVDGSLPEVGQKVFYHYVGGTYAGEYFGRKVDEDEGCRVPIFGGESGFLCGDVTHWMPREEGSKLPDGVLRGRF